VVAVFYVRPREFREQSYCNRYRYGWVRFFWLQWVVVSDKHNKPLEDAMDEIRSYIGSLNEQEVDTLLTNLHDRLKDLRAAAARNGIAPPPGDSDPRT
jgi:hypothetical protein